MRATIFLLTSLLVPASAATFDFDSVVLGTTTPFAYTVDGITATFDAPNFYVDNSFLISLTGMLLFSNDEALTLPDTLKIGFSKSLNSISLLFALRSDASETLTLKALMKGVEVGSVSASGLIPGGGFFPEGSISFSGTTFDSVVLTSTALDFAIDNLQVAVARGGGEVPEPATAALLLMGAAGLAAFRRVKRLARR